MASDRIREISILGTWSGGDAPLLTGLGQIKTAFNAAALALKDYEAEAARIDSDEEKSGLGKRNAKRAAAEQALAKIAEHRGRIPGFRKERDGLLDQRIAEPEPWRRVLHFLEETEIRRELASRDPLEREVILREAAANGDRATLDAARNAPAIAPLVSPELLAELDAVHLERARPDTAAAVRAHDRAIAEAEAALDGAEQHIREAAGLQRDLLAEMLNGSGGDEAHDQDSA